MAYRLSWVFACAFLAASPCLAQNAGSARVEPGPAVGAGPEQLPMRVGDRVRLRLSGPNKGIEIGTIAAIDHDGLTVRPVRMGNGDLEPPKDVRQHPFGSVSRVEIYRGRHRATGRGALAGALIAGVVVGIAEASACSSNQWGCTNGAPTAIYTLAGAGLGALIGSAFKVDSWEKVPVPASGPHRTVHLAQGAGIQVSLRL